MAEVVRLSPGFKVFPVRAYAMAVRMLLLSPGYKAFPVRAVADLQGAGAVEIHPPYAFT